MNQMYKKIFEVYGERKLREAENFDEEELKKAMKKFSLSEKECLDLLDAVYEQYYQWSLDAFTLGLHLGLSLLNSDTAPAMPPKAASESSTEAVPL